jgi:hypothetical protein
VETRNTEFTERAVNEIQDTQTVQLGSYQDTAQVTHSSVTQEVKQDPLKDFNMEGFDLNHAISREYVVASIPWLQSQASGTLLATLQFPKLLFDQAFIREKVQDFRYFKAGLRLTFRTTANKYLYGKFIVSYNPMPTLDAYDPSVLGTITTIPHILVSASASEAAVFDAPFIYNKRALDLAAYGPAEMCHFKVMVLNPLNSVTPDVDGGNIIVTAQFVDPVLHLPHDRDITFTVQSRRGAEAHLKSTAGSISSRHEELIPTPSKIKNTRKTVGRAFTRVLENTGTNVLSSVVAAGMFAMAGLSKPTTLDTAALVKVNPYSDTASGKGIDTSVKLAMDPENQISTQPNVGGMSEDEMNLLTIVGTPTLSNIVSYLPTSTSNVSIGILGPLGEIYNTYVDTISKQFFYWSGSYKFKIYITASLFHTVRGVFYLAEDSTASWENCYHKVVDIQGDTEVDFMMPYVAQSFASQTSSGTNFELYFKILSWSQPDITLSCPIHLNVYKAGDSDFRFGAPMETTFTTQSNPRYDFVEPFEPIHPSMTGYTQEGFLFGEEFTTLRELVHRYHATRKWSGGGTDPVWDTTPITGTTYLGLEKFGMMYRFRRGSIRLKLFYSEVAVPTRAAYLTFGANAAIQGFTLSSRNNPVVEVEAPWYSNLLFDTTGPQTQNYRLVLSGTGTILSPVVSRAGGDDFSLHFLRLPNMVVANNVSTTFGQPLLSSLYLTS